MEVGEGLPELSVQAEGAGLVGRAVRLRSVIEKVVSEQFVEELPITAALNLLGVAADEHPESSALSSPSDCPDAVALKLERTLHTATSPPPPASNRSAKKA